jgi:4-hydroxybenzoate polyprenyltransferase
MIAFLKLTRPLNLLIIAITMGLMRYGVINGNLQRGMNQLMVALDLQERPHSPAALGAQMPLWQFGLLIISTMLIAAAGNIINDYFDTRIDRINKPGEVIVGRSVKRRVAITAHLVLSGVGFLLAAIVAWRSGMLQLLAIPAFAIAALWTYSTTLKRQLIIGNLMIAVLAALVPLTVGLYEIPLMQQAFSEEQYLTLPGGEQIMLVPAFKDLWYWILGYSAFAFMSTLVRELQKDMADVRGDLAGGCRTVPIAWGMRWARALALFHIGILLLGVLAVRMILPGDRITYWYLGICVMAPLLLSAGFTYQAENRGEHLRAGLMMKLAMVMAVGYSLLIPHLP